MSDFVTAFPALRPRPVAYARRLIVRARTYARQSLCGIGGHDMYRTFTHNTVLERCVTCGHETPGITLPERAYQRTYSGDPTRHRLPKV